MWNRSNLKENAKVAFKRNYWKCVLVALILGICTGSGGTGSSASQSTDNIISEDYSEDYSDDYSYDMETPEDVLDEILPSGEVSSTVTILLVVGVLIVVLIAFALQFFLFGPLYTGCCNFFKVNAYEKADLNKLTLAFQKENYFRIASTMFLKDLYTGLWALLLIVPGIIKAYEYRMIPYIISDCPDISRKDAFRISKEMMYGNKWNAFVLDVSFLGWILLTVITCGAAGLFYVSPYVAATDAELFIAIREEYFRDQRG